jgi:hypothetical protein
MARDDNGQRERDCPVCGFEMMPPKNVLPGAKNQPAFSCHGCGVTALGDHSPKSGQR